MARSFVQQVNRKLNGILIEGFTKAGSAVWRALPSAKPEHYGLTRVADVPYRSGGNPAHLLDVYRPKPGKDTGPLPAVLFIHGGSFRILSKDTHFMMANAFAQAGYVVFTINYRLSPANRFPAAIEDAADAYRWVVENGARWGADVSRLIVAGESAGGNLALALAIMTTYARPEPYARRIFQLGVVPRAIVPMCGILQVSDPERSRGHVMAPFMRDRIEACAEAYLGPENIAASPERAFADPIVILESGKPTRPFPPTFSSVGTRDPLLEDTLRLGDRLRALDVKCEVQTILGEPHAFQAMTFRPKVRKQWTDMFAFLDRTLAS